MGSVPQDIKESFTQGVGRVPQDISENFTPGSV